MSEKRPWEGFELKALSRLRDGMRLFDFQQFAVYQALSRPRFIYGMSTGTGKTVASYAAYFYYKQKFPNTKLIIITIASAVTQYFREYAKFFNEDKDFNILPVTDSMHKLSSLVSGKKYRDRRLQAYEAFGMDSGSWGSVDALVMNYTVARVDFKEICKVVSRIKERGEHLFLILDEATSVKNMRSETYRAVRYLAQVSERVLAATATITKGKLEEIYGILSCLGIKLFRDKQEFLDRYCVTWTPPGMARWQRVITGYRDIPGFIRLIQDYLIVLKKQDVVDYLPAFTSRIDWLRLSGDQLRVMKEIYSGVIDCSFIENAEDFEGPGEGAYQMVTQLTEIGYIGRALLDERVVTRVGLDNVKKMSPKTEAVIRALVEDYEGEKIIIYTPSRVYLDILKRTIESNESVPDYYRRVLEISGGVTGESRDNARMLFQTSSDHNLLLLTDAGVEALNLEAGSVILVVQMPKSAGNLIQLAGRISRVSTKHKSLSLRYFLMEDSQDEDALLRIQQQLLIVHHSLGGEVERGLLIPEVLQDVYRPKGYSKDQLDAFGLPQTLTVERLMQESGKQSMLIRHKRRKDQYA